MPAVPLPGLAPAVPEIVLVCAAMALLIIGVFRGEGSSRLVSWLSVAVLIATLCCRRSARRASGGIGFYGMFVTDAFAVFMKALVLLGSAVTLSWRSATTRSTRSRASSSRSWCCSPATGMMVMISANDLITLYLGLELQSLALYVVASFDRDSVRSTEAGLKYFVLGALASGMLLYGASLIYGFAGTTEFAGSRLCSAAARRPPPALSSASSLSRSGSPSSVGGAVPYVDPRRL